VKKAYKEKRIAEDKTLLGGFTVLWMQKERKDVMKKEGDCVKRSESSGVRTNRKCIAYTRGSRSNKCGLSIRQIGHFWDCKKGGKPVVPLGVFPTLERRGVSPARTAGLVGGALRGERGFFL